MKTIPICLIALAAPLIAGELVPAQIPASAKWMLHADLDALRASETGKAIFSRIESEHGAKLRAMKRMFSLHPLDDLKGVTLYGDGRPDHGVALIHGTFDRAHLEEVIQAADDYKSSAQAGTQIHSWSDKGKPQHAAFASADLIAFSRHEDLLRAALDALKANAPAQADPFFLTDGGKPLVAASARLGEIDMPADAARILKLASVLHLAANEHAGRFTLRAAAESGDATQADRLRRMLDGVLAFAEAGHPDLARNDFRSEVVTSAGKPALTASASLPVAAWLGLMRDAAAAKKAKP